MATINSDLLQKLQKKLGLSQPRVYALIARKMGETHLPRHLAAVALAADSGINVGKRAYATDDDRALMRSIASVAPARSASAQPPSPSTAAPRARGSRAARRPAAPTRKSNNVMVVHGRDMSVRNAMFAFLRALGLNPIEWAQGVRATRKGAPVIREVLDAMFKNAAAVVVLLTPDDEARLKRKFLKSSDPAHERNLTGQARPNVLFEAGRAFGSHPDTTILVQVGPHRPFSDTAGVHIVHLGNDPATRTDLANRLETAGCAVDRTGTDWLSEGDFRVS